MKRPLDSTSSPTTNNQKNNSSPPKKSQRMGSDLVCPKADKTEDTTIIMNDQVEKMDAVATGEGAFVSSRSGLN